MEKRIYHYTTIENLNSIIETGEIKLATAGIDKKEKPGAWFSSNPYWENTVNKLVVNQSGMFRTLSFEEMQNHGIARIEVQLIEDIIPFGKFFYRCNMKKSTFNSLKRAGRQKGANPAEWFASLTPVNRENWLKVEVMVDGEWLEQSVLKAA